GRSDRSRRVLAPALAPPPEPVATGPTFPETFAALVDKLDETGSIAIAARLRHGARVVSYTPPEIVLSGSRPISADTLGDFTAALKALTQTAWRVTMADAPGAPTLREMQDAADAANKEHYMGSPMMRAAREAFPDAELESWPGQRSTA
ncbi:MAG: DNA polymerase III subunit gamma/tau, partial [Sphingomonas sp.]